MADKYYEDALNNYTITDENNQTYHKMTGDIAEFFRVVISYIKDVFARFEKLGIKL